MEPVNGETPGEERHSSQDAATQPERARTRTMTEAALAANRSNAQRSTGPTSDVGKVRSSRNAQKKGTYARTLWPITGGRYAEDPEEFIAFVAASVESHEPRDIAEENIVEQIVITIVRLQRNTRVESDLIASAGSTPQANLRALAAHYKANPMTAVISEWMAAHVSGERSAESHQYRHMCELIREVKAHGKIHVRDLWTDERQPGGDGEWKRVFAVLLRHYWAEDAEAAEEWASAVGLEANLAQRDFEDALRTGSALGTLTESDRAARLSERLIRQLRGLYEVLRSLQERDLIPLDHEDAGGA